MFSIEIVDIVLLLLSFYFIYLFKIRKIYVLMLSLAPHILLLLYRLVYIVFEQENINIYTFLILSLSYIIMFPALIVYALILSYIQTYYTIAYWRLFLIGGLLGGSLGTIILFVIFDMATFTLAIPFITGALSPVILQYFIERKKA
jgi:hypothetical protein